jgi:hypothetical protein
VFAARTAAAATPRARVRVVVRVASSVSRPPERKSALVDETCGSFAAWFKPQ